MSSKEKIRENVKLLNPIDDALFTVMAENIDFCQEILRVFLEDSKLKVISNFPQKTFKNLQGRSIRVDLLCDLLSRKSVNVEVEKNYLNHVKRVRYNSSIITTNITDPGIKFDKIPDLIIIYLTRRDIFGKHQSKYYVDEVLRGFNDILNTGCVKIFINAEVDDGSDISKLMKIFIKDNEYDNNLFPKTSSLKYHYKETEEGVNIMSAVIERLFKEDLEHVKNEALIEGEFKGKCEIVKELLKINMPIEQIKKISNLSDEEFNLCLL